MLIFIDKVETDNMVKYSLGNGLKIGIFSYDMYDHLVTCLGILMSFILAFVRLSDSSAKNA
jgi:hypothetical protein